MTGVPTTADPTRVRAASRLLAPRLVLAVIWSAILIGMVTTSGWALPLFWALMALTGFSTFLALLGAKPLPAMSERSHLFLRLSWLARYGTATAVLCLSTFLGALAGFQAGTADAQATVDGVGGMLGVVGIWAAKIAAVLFFGWLVIDVHRMSKARRRKGIRRGIRKIVPKEFRAWLMHEAVTNWFLALSSRAHATVSLGAIVISLLMTLSAPGN